MVSQGGSERAANVIKVRHGVSWHETMPPINEKKCALLSATMCMHVLIRAYGESEWQRCGAHRPTYVE